MCCRCWSDTSALGEQPCASSARCHTFIGLPATGVVQTTDKQEVTFGAPKRLLQIVRPTVTWSPGIQLRARLLALGLIATVPALIVIVWTQSLERRRARAAVVEDIRQVTQLAPGQQAHIFDCVQRLQCTLA